MVPPPPFPTPNQVSNDKQQQSEHNNNHNENLNRPAAIAKKLRRGGSRGRRGRGCQQGATERLYYYNFQVKQTELKQTTKLTRTSRSKKMLLPQVEGGGGEGGGGAAASGEDVAVEMTPRQRDVALPCSVTPCPAAWLPWLYCPNS